MITFFQRHVANVNVGRSNRLTRFEKNTALGSCRGRLSLVAEPPFHLSPKTTFEIQEPFSRKLNGRHATRKRCAETEG